MNLDLTQSKLIHKQESAGNHRLSRPWYIDVILAFELKILQMTTIPSHR